MLRLGRLTGWGLQELQTLTWDEVLEWLQTALEIESEIRREAGV